MICTEWVFGFFFKGQTVNAAEESNQITMEQILLVVREGLVSGITGFQVGTYAKYAHTVKLLRLIAEELGQH